MAWPALGSMCLVAAGVGSARGTGFVFSVASTAIGAGLARGGRRRLPLVALPLIVGLGWVSGQLSVGREQSQLTASLLSGFETLTVMATNDSAPSPFGGGWFVGRAIGMETGRADGPGPNLLIRIPDGREVFWSEIVRVSGQLLVRSGGAGGHFYAGVVEAEDVEVLSSRMTPLVTAGNGIRRRVLRLLDGDLPAEALLAGFLIGHSADLPPSDQVAMRRAGISHFVAVSGANVAGFLMLWWLLLGPIGFGARRRGWMGLVGLAIFLVATRWEPSVVRAGLMAAVVFAGRAAGLAIDAWTALGAGAVLAMLAAPALVSDLGFQLSLIATVGIMAGYDLLPPSLPQLVRKPLGVTIAAQAAVTPLLLAQGNGVPLLSPLTNLLAAPLVAAATLLGAIGVVLGGGPLLGAALAASHIVLTLARSAAWYPQLGVGAVALLAGSILVTIRWSRIRPVMLVLISAVMAVAIVPRVPSGPAVIFIDVGQGDAALLFSASGEAVLVDGGPDPRLLWQALYQYRVKRLRLVVATHPHDDHIAGLVGLAQRLPIDELWEAGEHHSNPTWNQIRDEMEAASVPVANPGVGTRLGLAGMVLEVLGPKRRYDNANDQSIVVLARSQTASLLMTGDVEAAAQLELDPIDVDILKVPHHGGNTSLPGWLVATRPEVALISVGPNRFGHPAREIVDLLEGAGAQVIMTRDEGDVFLPLDRPVSWRGRARARVRESGRCPRLGKWRQPVGRRPIPRLFPSGACRGFRWRSERPQGPSLGEPIRSSGGRHGERERHGLSCESLFRVVVQGRATTLSACALDQPPTWLRKRRRAPPRRPSDIGSRGLFRCR
ncbi:MAG TPA: ComEC/Rec2 family competence protein [Acidimicrobiia bacterium]|nr:ComEC/Rec2 family competence protein [Acidimicrobiia bacterium]